MRIITVMGNLFIEYVLFRYHPNDAITISQANRKTDLGNTEDSSSVFNMWRDVVIVEEDQRSRYKYSIIRCSLCACSDSRMLQSVGGKGE